MKKIIIAVIALLAWTTGVSAHFDQSLSYGTSGQNVEELQEFLATQNCFNHAPTGYFGFITLSAVKCFQAKNNIITTGYFGILSRSAANGIADAMLNESTQAQFNETGTTTPTIMPAPYAPAQIQQPEVSQRTYRNAGADAPVIQLTPSFVTGTAICRPGDVNQVMPFSASNYTTGSITLRSNKGYGAKYALEGNLMFFLGGNATGFTNLDPATYTYAVTLDGTPINGSFIIESCPAI